MLFLGCVVLVALAGSVSALLRHANAVGAAVAGGLVAGLLLGPTLLGRVAPDLYETVWVGGAAERRAMDDLVSRQGADMAVARFAELDETARAELAAAHERELAPKRAALEAARRDHRRPLRAFALALVGTTLLLGGGLAVPRADRRGGAGLVLSMGGWAAALPGAVVFVVLRELLDVELPAALVASGAVAMGPFVLREIDRRAADDAEVGGARLCQVVGRFSSLVGGGLAAWGLWLVGGPATWAALTLVALALGWWAPARPDEALRRFLDAFLLPALAACVTLQTDLFVHASLWPLLLVLLVSGDGRWAGATLGAVLAGGRRWLPTMRLAMASMACGPTQLAVAAVGVYTGVLSPPLTLALAAGALLLEVGAPIRRWMANEILAVERVEEEEGER
jgi:hypothetical protein